MYSLLLQTSAFIVRFVVHTVTPHTINTHTSPEVVALVVVVCMVGVMLMLVLVLVLVLKKHKTTHTGTTQNHKVSYPPHMMFGAPPYTVSLLRVTCAMSTRLCIGAGALIS